MCLDNNFSTNQSLFKTFKRSFSNLPKHEVVTMPALSPSAESSRIVQWMKKEGDFIDANEKLATVGTDKAEVDWIVTDAAYVAKILLQPTENVAIGTPVCIFVDNKNDVAAFKNYNPTASQSSSSTPEQAKTSAPSSPASSPSSQPKTSSSPSPSSALSNLPSHKVEGLPALSPTVSEGSILQWTVKEGDLITEGSSVAEVQTDKSVVTWTSTDEAYVAKILVPAGDKKVSVGAPVIVLVENKKDVASFSSVPKEAFLEGASGQQTKSEQAPSTSTSVSNKQEEKPQEKASSKSQINTSSSTQSVVFASPYAKKLSKDMNISLQQIGQGSGFRGRIVSSDVERASKEQKVVEKQTSTPTAAPKKQPSGPKYTGERTHEDIPLSAMREIIAKRLSQSMYTSPHYYETVECQMDKLIQARLDMNDEAQNIKVSVNDFIIKASAFALRDVPMVNVQWKDKFLRRLNYIDISVAVATPTGLITPIIVDADKKGLLQISNEMRDLATRARENKLKPEEFQGGTFTISNLGMFGIHSFTAIINPPQSCILALGGAVQVLKPDNSPKGFRVANVMYATLSSDHRSVDGALAAQWLSAFKKYIENPAKLLL